MAVATQFIRQAAAIPLKDGAICLITSSNGKRWVVPKGLIDPGHTAGEAALLEAWEEAGLGGGLRPEPGGRYLYNKFGENYPPTAFVREETHGKGGLPQM